MIEKIQKGLHLIVQILSGFIAIFVLFTLIFSKLKREGSSFQIIDRVLMDDYVNNFACILILLNLIILWFYKKNKKEAKTEVLFSWKPLIFVSMGLLCIQIIFVSFIYFEAGNDVFSLRYSAECFVNDKWDAFYNLEYYQGCPNNLIAYMLYIIAYQIANWIGVDGYIVLIGCNILLANLAVLLAGLSAYKLTHNQRIMWLVYGVGVVLYGVTPWLSVPYTDMLSIAVPIGTIYLYLCLRERKLLIFVKWFLIFLLPFLFYGLKPLNIIIGIAIILCELLYVHVSDLKVSYLMQILGAILLVCVCVCTLQTGVERYVRYEKDENKEFSLAWVLFLGSDAKTYGQWSYENLLYATQFDTHQERNEQLLLATKERISDMGVTGYVSHLMNKIHVFYNDGNFGWGTTGAIVLNVPDKNSKISQLVCNIFYPPENYGFVPNTVGYGAYFQGYATVKQCIWLWSYVFMVIGICWPVQDKTISILKTTWIGVFLFTMLFETHARLLISFLPVFVLIAGIGMDRLDKIRKRMQNE